MRKYSRKKITLKDVSMAALSKPQVKPTDEVDEAMAKLKANGWMDVEHERDDEDMPALTYTGFVPTRPKRPKAFRDVVTVKRTAGERERHGKLFVHGKWAD